VELSITNYRAWTLGEEPHGRKASKWLTFDLCAPETHLESAEEKIILEVDCTPQYCLMPVGKPYNYTRKVSVKKILHLEIKTNIFIV